MKRIRKLRGLLLHVGADTSNLGIVGPLFPEGTFEFIPLGPEYESLNELMTYDELPSRNQHECKIRSTIPTHKTTKETPRSM